jgi:glycerol uptake facilitator protein
VEQRGPSAYAAEFIGTFFLVFFVVMVLTGELGSIAAPQPYLDFAVIGLVHAFVIILIVSSLGRTSGALVNPALTVALAAVRKLAPVDAAIYIVCQLAGAVAATLVVKLLLLDEGRAAHFGAVATSKALSGKTLAAALVELIGTFALMWAVMATAVDPRGQKNLAPVVIGVTLGLAVMALAPLTGAGFNPARAFGPALVDSFFNGGGKFIVIYVLGPVVGALLAAFTYQAIVMESEGAAPSVPSV